MSRPIRVTLSPDAVDEDSISNGSATLIALHLDMILDGALTAGFDANAVCVAQTTGAAAALLLNGVNPNPGAVRDRNERLIFTCASDDNSGITFAVVGLDKLGAHVTETVTGPDGSVSSQQVFSTNSFYVITSITSSAAVTGNVEVGINGIATFTTPQHVTITATSNESGGNFTITGTDRDGDAQTETLVGPNNTTVIGVMNFATVTHIAGFAAAAGVAAGVDGTCEGRWLPLSTRTQDFNVGMGASVSSGAVVTYTVQHTFDDVFASNFVESTAVAHNHDTMVGQTGNLDGNYTNPVVAVRMDITAHTSGTASLNVIQTSR